MPVEYLFDALSSLQRAMRKNVFLFLDYDGTLAPIAKTPDKAGISARVQTLLKDLAECPRCKVAVISGRSLQDIKKLVGLKNILYSGNHGLELEGPRIKFESPVSGRYRAILEKIKRDLSARLANFRGVLVEDKGLSLGVHYRMVPQGKRPQVKDAFHEAVIVDLAAGRVAVKYGKMVLEVRPPGGWDKGQIVLWLLARQRFAKKSGDILPIFIGDDITDEDAFKALRPAGVTVFVGRPKASFARYYLRNTGEVALFLEKILGYCRGAAAWPN